MDILNKSLQHIKGVGEHRQKLFVKLGITSVDLLFCYYPRNYIDMNSIASAADDTLSGDALYRLTVIKKHANQLLYGKRTLTRIEAAGDGVAVDIVFFNNTFVPASLKEGEEYLFFGRMTRNLISCGMSNPWLIKEEEINRLIPIYRSTDGLTSKQIGRIVSAALSEYSDEVEETLPAYITQRYGLLSRRDALIKIHQPKDLGEVNAARRRLIFEEFLVMLLGISQFRRHTRLRSNIRIYDDISKAFINSLPFEMTGAQLRSLDDILRDFKSAAPMNRLLQGDVGSGKTVVAAAAAAVAVKSGYQAAVMVPTEILASQHFRTFTGLLAPFDIPVTLLTGSLKGRNRTEILKTISGGDSGVIIGTQALIGKDVVYNNLGLVIADEQHRFGVEQRNLLSDKGINPHLLVMSATPIPRTLALIIYGDLDMSVIDELPPGRIPAKTYYVDSSYRQRYLNFVKKQVESGRQVFIVCSLIEENEGNSERLAAIQYKRQLEEEYLSGYSVGLTHGQMKPAEKAAVMKRFAEGSIDILVSTVVIEVGIDVPNASTMIIENAENFGLSTLHQLRGRIGRGQTESFCILVSDSTDSRTKERLNLLKNTCNGFSIAQYDLKTRGPGELLGRRQHGLPELKIADLAHDKTLLTYAQSAAKDILEEDPGLDRYTLLRTQVEMMFNRTNEQQDS